MKTNLEVTGRVELDRHEVTQAIIEFLAKHNNYKAEKVIYEAIGGSTFRAVVEVKGVATNTEEKIHSYSVKEEKQTRQHPSGYTIENGGVFDTIRALLNERFIKAGRKNPTVFTDIDKFLEDVQAFHPKMDMPRLKIYLADKRQFDSNYYWNGRKNGTSEGEIIMRAEINFIPGRK